MRKSNKQSAEGGRVGKEGALCTRSLPGERCFVRPRNTLTRFHNLGDVIRLANRPSPSIGHGRRCEPGRRADRDSRNLQLRTRNNDVRPVAHARRSNPAHGAPHVHKSYAHAPRPISRTATFSCVALDRYYFSLSHLCTHGCLNSPLCFFLKCFR